MPAWPGWKTFTGHPWQCCRTRHAGKLREVAGMTTALNRRLLVLESLDSGDTAKPLPEVVPDSTTDIELARLRKNGREIYRESDPAFIELFV